MRSIDEAMNQFQKSLWASDRPIPYCIEFVEDLLREQLRLNTLMRESKKIILSISGGEEQDEDRMNYLLNGLSGHIPAIFLDHLTEIQRQEYNRYLKKQTTFEDIQT